MTLLPHPTAEQQTHSAELLAVIRDDIAACGDWISFARYMELALYAPGLGYYSAGSTKFGAAGDFVTAPEISSLFARTLARQAAQVLRDTGGDVLELGAGTGKLAAQLLLELQRTGALPQRYYIVEVSAYLQEVQRNVLASMLPLVLQQKVVWLQELPTAFDGFMFGNEVLDALPVHVTAWREDGIYERGIAWQGDELTWQERRLGDCALLDKARRLSLPPGYVSEICLAAPALVASLAAALQHGLLLFVDYGFPRREIYHPQRTTGTLMCHYRQHAHDDPLLYPGLQDITAHVDFTSVAEAGVTCGLQLLGYATQAQFLINCGITDVLGAVSPSDAFAYLPLATQAHKLLSPAEMGELFKVIALGRSLDAPLLGFRQGDKRHAL